MGRLRKSIAESTKMVLSVLILLTYSVYACAQGDLGHNDAEELRQLVLEMKVDYDKEIANLKQEIEKLKQEKDDIYAFTAVANYDNVEPRYFNQGQRIPFQTVITNVGAGYASSNSEFVCKDSGLYLFTVTTLGYYDQLASAHLMVDGIILGTTYGEGKGSFGASSVSAIVDCRAGSRVYVESERDGIAIFSDYRYHSSFSGMSIKLDELMI